MFLTENAVTENDVFYTRVRTLAGNAVALW